MDKDKLDIRSIKGVGAKTAEKLKKAGFETVEDVCKEMDFYEKAKDLGIKNADEITANANLLFMEKYTSPKKVKEKIPGMKRLMRVIKVNHKGTTYQISEADEVDGLVNAERYANGKRFALDLKEKSDKALSKELFLQYVK